MWNLIQVSNALRTPWASRLRTGFITGAARPTQAQRSSLRTVTCKGMS